MICYSLVKSSRPIFSVIKYKEFLHFKAPNSFFCIIFGDSEFENVMSL